MDPAGRTNDNEDLIIQVDREASATAAAASPPGGLSDHSPLRERAVEHGPESGRSAVHFSELPTGRLSQLAVEERGAAWSPEGPIESQPTGILLPFGIDQQPTSLLPPLSIDQWPTGLLPPLSIDQWPTGPLPILSIDQWPTGPLPVVGARPSAQRAAPTGGLSYVALVRNLAKNSAVYALAALGSPLISLVLAPFLARHLSLTDYGVLTVLNAAIGLVAGITQLGLGSAFFRTYNYDYSAPTDRKRILATTLLLLLAVAAPATAGLVLVAPSVAALLFGRTVWSTAVAIAGGVVLIQNLTVPGFAWMRAESRPLSFSLLSLANLLVSLAANIVFVGVLQLGVIGALLATGSGYAVVAVCTLPVIVLRAGVRTRRDVAWSLLSFGVPQVFSFVAYWALQLLDRYLLSILASLPQTATYGVAYSLGSVVSTAVIVPFNLAWPTAMYAIAKRKDGPELFRLVFRWLSLLLLFAAFTLSFAGKVLLAWLFPPSYQSAAAIIPVVAASIALYGIYILFTTGISVHRQTWLAAVFISTAALANLALNLVLIPLYGTMGAAVATFLGYLVLVCFAYVVNQRIYPIPYEVGRFVVAFGLGVGIYYEVAMLARAWEPLWTWPIYLLGVVVYGGWLVVLARGGRPRGAPRR